MSDNSKISNFSACVVLNSTVYFLIAYYFVVFALNLFSMAIASILGFDVELFYYGFTLAGKQWTTGDMILVFFVGNALTLLTAVLFELLYRKRREFVQTIKIFYLWVYLISIMWFFGNIIVGAFFNFGIGAALRALHVSFSLRLILAMIAVFAMMFLGYRSQKHIRLSSNLYYQSLSKRFVKSYFLQQIVIPIAIGIIIIILLKIPHINEYNYVDIYLLFTFAFFLVGLFFQTERIESITFKNHNITSDNLKRKSCSINYLPLVIMIIFLAIIRFGLINGVAF